MAFADGKLMSQHRERKKKVNVKTRSEKKDKEDKKVRHSALKLEKSVISKVQKHFLPFLKWQKKTNIAPEKF